MLELVLKIGAAYLLGSVMGALVLGPLMGVPDVRRDGSGNAGATNAARTRGKSFGALVALFDLLKGVVAVALIPMIPMPGLAATTDPEWVRVFCGVAVVLGHVWPIWHRFQGGKGAATLVGVFAVVAPLVLVPVLAVWVVTLVLSGYVGLATVLAAVTGPVALLFMGVGPEGAAFTLALVMALTLIYTHRDNLRRLCRGEEHRFERVRIFRRRGGS